MKLDKVEIAIVVLAVWAASFASAFLISQDGFRALGGSIWFVLLGFAAVGTINKRRQKKAK